MGLEATTLAAISAGTTAVGTAYSISQNQKQRSEQKRLQRINEASNKAAQMEERRQQVREERIKRARILQAGEAGGTSGSSGEYGALSSLSTQLSSNIGSNLSRIGLSQEASASQQSIADSKNNIGMMNFLTSSVNSGIDMSGSIFKTDSDPIGSFINQYEQNNK